jgi:hypothetical protein
MEPPYPAVVPNPVESMRSIWLDGYVAGAEFREQHGIRLRTRVYPPGDRRFWEQVEVGDARRCWPWRGTMLPDGRGEYRMAAGRGKAHRVAYTFAVGAIPRDWRVVQTCGLPECCNPRHLVALNRRDAAALRGAGRCRRGHLFSDHGYLRRDGKGFNCRACRRDRERAARRAAGAWPADSKVCRRGHSLAAANLYITPDGHRRCRACVRLRKSHRKGSA